MTKTLYILRHAKAQNAAATQDDASRALAPRGIHAAQSMATHMQKQRLRPQLVWCSSAVRTRQTIGAMQEIFTPPLEVEYREALYNASAGEIIAMLPALSDAVESLMVLAHNPGMHELAVRLARSGDDDKLDALAMKYPTAALTVVQFDTPHWRDVAVAGGTLVDFITPGMLGGVDD